jgi:predicted secreted protein
MGVAGSLMIIVIGWWLAFFALLPIGARTQVDDGHVVPGTEPGAPTTPKLARKAIWALVIALLMWAVLYWLIEIRRVTVDDILGPRGSVNQRSEFASPVRFYG